MAVEAVARDLMTLLDAPGVGPSRVRKLLKKWHIFRESRSILDDGLLKETLTSDQVAALPASRERVKQRWDELEKKQIHVLSVLDPTYPDVLRQSLGDDAPLLLLCIGNRDLLYRASVGFCGSREATDKGLATARDCSDLLAREGITIVSGYASGVDMNAHRAALAAGGTTTVVMAEGILRFRVKQEIKEDWDPERTLVVSEFAPNVSWSVGHAMQRNRTICGLSRAMILIEARSTGGSIQAGRDCLSMGLPLFAAVYEGMPEAATGNEELLQQGARRLMKSRSTGRPNVRPVLDVMGGATLTAGAGSGFPLLH